MGEEPHQEPHRVLVGAQCVGCVGGADDTVLLHNCTLGVEVAIQHLRRRFGPMAGPGFEHELASALVEENFHIVLLASRMVDASRHSGVEVLLALASMALA